MLPILPLDGGRVLGALLPSSLAQAYARTERYGMLIVLGMVVFPFLSHMLFGRSISLLSLILTTPLSELMTGIAHLFHLPL